MRRFFTDNFKLMLSAAVLFVISCTVSAADLFNTDYMQTRFWVGSTGGKAPVKPEISLIKSPVGSAVQVKAISNGAYQGMDLHLPEALDMSKVGWIEFDFYQTAYSRSGNALLKVYYGEDGRKGTGLFLSFKYTHGQWNHIRIPVDPRTNSGFPHQGSAPAYGLTRRMHFCVYGALNKTGEMLAVANLKFIPRSPGNGKIFVQNYRYENAPESGDAKNTLLTDGKLDKNTQCMYPQYSSDPSIVFDLGALYLVDGIRVEAVAAPGQNIADITVESSQDGKSWRASGHIVNSNTDGKVQKYAVEGKKLNALGRYFRLRMSRSRSDFFIQFGEISFSGKIPSDEEFTAVANASYNYGPDMPELNAENYCISKTANGSFAVCRKNGIAVELTVENSVLVKRIWGLYDLSDGKKSVKLNDWAAKVSFCKLLNDGTVEVVFTFDKYPGITFKRQYGWHDGVFFTRLSFDSSRKDRQILQTSTQVLIPQEVRKGSRYESWGAGHTLEHRLADDFNMDLPADSGPVVVLESPKSGKTFLHTRYFYKDRYVQIGSGTVTVAGFGDKRTIFTGNGWILGDGLFEVNPNAASGSIESRLIITSGSMPQAFDRYLELPEAKAFRAAITRPAWLDDVRYICGAGWNSMFGDNSVLAAQYFQGIIREGILNYTAKDGNFNWGDFPTDKLRNQFGGIMTGDEVRARISKLRKAAPGIKICEYTWLWSATDNSKLYRAHPNWFIKENAQGNLLNFFPNWGTNYYRLIGIKESGDEAFTAITKFIRDFNQDIWYLDGGGSPSAIDWKNLRIDEPDAYDRLYMRIRNDIRRDGDRAIFFNHPENPLADWGYFENSSGVFTNNWRDGATWMYKFKLWQRPDPRFSPLYIYWTPQVDKAVRQYVVGTGLRMTKSRNDDMLANVSLLSASQQTRCAQLVPARYLPNWRYNNAELFELMPLTVGDSGWVMIRSHHNQTANCDMSVEVAPLGKFDSDKPLYIFEYELMDHAKHKGTATEPEAEEAYRTTGWQSDFIVAASFMEKINYVDILKRKVSLKPGSMKLVYITQTPALVFSVDNMRNQMLLSETLKVRITGEGDSSSCNLQVESGRKTAEILILLPKGKIVGDVRVNGKTVEFTPFYLADGRFVRLTVPEGSSKVKAVFINNPAPAQGKYVMDISKDSAGRTMRVKLKGRGNKHLQLNIYSPENPALPVWSTPIKANSDLVIQLPTVLTGGKYTACVLDVNGKVLTAETFYLNNAPSKYPRLEARYPASKSVRKVSKVNIKTARSDIEVTGIGIVDSPGNGKVTVDAGKGRIDFAADPNLQFVRGVNAGALEIKAKRYLKVRVSGNFWWFAKYGHTTNSRNISHRYGDADTTLALSFDFGTPQGYTVRSFAGMGILSDRRRNGDPLAWGTRKVPQNMFSLSSFGMGTDEVKEEVYYLDTYELCSPGNWDGRLWIGLCYQNPAPDRKISVTVEGTYDKLPTGAKLNKLLPVKGGRTRVEKRAVKLPRAGGRITIDGNVNEADWAQAAVFNEFYALGALTAKIPPTVIRMLRDDKFIYVAAEFTDPDRLINNDSAAQFAWYIDGIEIYFQYRDGKSFKHYILAANNLDYAAKVTGKKRQPATSPQWKGVVDKKVWRLEAAIPIEDFKSFNMGRNRSGTGKSMHISLAPGKQYRNFDAFELIW